MDDEDVDFQTVLIEGSSSKSLRRANRSSDRPNVPKDPMTTPIGRATGEISSKLAHRNRIDGIPMTVVRQRTVGGAWIE